MKRFLSVIVCIHFISLLAIAHADNLANSPGSEIADGVFRPLGFWDILDKVEHAAVYRNSDGRKDWDPMKY